MWKPYTPFNVPMRVITTVKQQVNGVYVKRKTDGRAFLGSVRTFGGTETEKNGVKVIEDTAVVNCWYSPDITSGCYIRFLTDGSEWEILGSPENIDQKNQWLEFKIKRVGGSA